MSGRRPTMLDVAQRAGVSRALVSIVMRGVPGASDETREHVLRVAAELGYVPDARASALRSRGAGPIGVAFRLDQAFHAALVEELYAAADALGREMVLSAITPVRDERRALGALASHRCGAMVVLEPRVPAEQLVLLAGSVPMVVVASAVDAQGVVSIASDDAAAMHAVADHLAGLGHRHLWYAGSPGSGGDDDRREALAEACRGLGVELDVVAGGNVESAGAAVADGWLCAGRRPTGIVCFNDACAAGVQDVLLRAGVRVPDDVSLVGFDDAPLAGLPHRALTTVHQDLDEIAREAMAAATDGADGADGAHPRVRRVATALVVRTSTGPCRGA